MENLLSMSIQCQSKGMKQNKRTSSRQTSSFERSKLISDPHDTSKMATLHAKNREKLSQGVMGSLHNPPVQGRTEKKEQTQ